jgi:hypothetical protein
VVRYKIKTGTDESYRELVELLRGKVAIFVASPRRRMLGTGDIPVSLRQEVIAHGGRITKDQAYQFDNAAGA